MLPTGDKLTESMATSAVGKQGEWYEQSRNELQSGSGPGRIVGGTSRNVPMTESMPTSVIGKQGECQERSKIELRSGYGSGRIFG